MTLCECHLCTDVGMPSGMVYSLLLHHKVVADDLECSLFVIDCAIHKLQACSCQVSE